MPARASAARVSRRRGSILPLLTITLIALMGLVALAIDLGMVAMARTQCQNAADCAALAGARTLSGDPTTSNNYANCEPAARKAVGANKVLNTYINGNDTTNVAVSIGAYAYDPTTSLFTIKIPKGATDPYSLVRVTVNASSARFFSRVWSFASVPVSATATAAHRPRDVALVLDFSGSMRYASCLGIPAYPPYGSPNVRNNGSGTGSGSNNPESVYPKFGHYSATATAGLQFTSATMLNSDQYTPSNITEADSYNDNRPPLVGDFYQHVPYTDPDIPAFNNTNGTGPTVPADASLDADNFAGGDKPLKNSMNLATNSYAYTLQDALNTTSATSTNGKLWEGTSPVSSGGYQTITGTAFKGYTQGPRYWGKTFFIWPPDKVSTNDWRRKFFGTNDNTRLFDSGGNWKVPASTSSGVTTTNYTINYAAILTWIKASPSPFPPRLHAGHVQYYSSIPSTIDTSSFPPADRDQRFWKEYIDYCLGLQQTGSTSWSVITPAVGYGDDYTWTSSSYPIQITSPPSDGRYMNYADNPKRPRTHFWFGPMTMVDFISNFNQARFWAPGDCHEAPLYACKLAVRAALTDAQNNHPNDYMSLVLFSYPKTSASDASNYYGQPRFNAPRVPLGTNYPLMTASLWFPPSTLNADGTNNLSMVTPYDAGNDEVPRAAGVTCYAMPLMLAYNQFRYTTTSDTTLRRWVTPSTTVPEGLAGGMGRKGAQKMVIFMTDGAPNTKATAALSTATNPKYYPVRYNAANQAGSEYPAVTYVGDNDSGVLAEINGIIDQLKADNSTARRPFRLHAIGFGPVFDASNPDQAACLATLQSMQYHGNTQASASTPLDSFKLATGTDAQVMTKLQTAITTIMQGSIQIVLLE
ncbi:MAG TPA: pilus assembly protein TadG-related protein [Gemmataceae bacterium]